MSEKRIAHIVLMGKGGVSKTTISTYITQYYIDNNVKIMAIDTDQVNASFFAFKRLNVRPLEIVSNNQINQRGWDTLVELLYNNKDSDAIIDNGASSFLPLLSYMIENDIVELLDSFGYHTIFHIIVAGGESFGHCLNGFTSIVDQFSSSSASFFVWLNSFLGTIELPDGRSFFEIEEYNERKSKISAVINIPVYNRDTYGKDIEYMLSNNLTFTEMIETFSANASIVSKHRYQKMRNELYAIMDDIKIISTPSSTVTKRKKEKQKELEIK